MNPRDFVNLLSVGPVAISPGGLDGLTAQAASLFALVQAGMSPERKFDAAIRGLPAIAVELVGTTAWIDVSGPIWQGAPWWAKAYLDITDTADLSAAIRSALATPKVDAIALRINTPGGSASGLEGVVSAIEEAQSLGIPVTAAIQGLCCSAGYYLAAACDRITATPDSLVGCLGTYCVIADTSAADAAMGIRYEVVSTGGVKGHGADGRITAELRAEMQAMVTSYGELFKAVVAAGRPGVADTAALFTGQSWIGAEALAKGLVDEVARNPAVMAGRPRGSASPSSPAAVPSSDQDVGTVASTAAAAAPKKASTMDHQLQAALSALSAAHPTHAAALVAAATAPGATEASLAAVIAAAEREAVQARCDAAEARAAAAEAEVAALKAVAAKHQAHAQHRDPGADDQNGQVRIIPLTKSASLTVADVEDLRTGKARMA